MFERKFRYPTTKNGIAMIMALGVLTLLTLIGTTFAINSILEQKQAWKYVEKVKARYLAEGGLARAIVELKYGSQGVRANAVDTTAETWYSSGYSDSSFFSGQGSYVVAVVDCASRINLNDQNTDLRLSQILQNLNTIIGASLTTSDCDNIAYNRPYSGKEEIKLYLSGNQAQVNSKYAAIEPYVTIYGFVDCNVVNPIDLSTPVYHLQPRAPINVNTASQQVIQAVLTGLRSDRNCPNCGGGRIYQGRLRRKSQLHRVQRLR
jgi:type II secretory pathway component PulK